MHLFKSLFLATAFAGAAGAAAATPQNFIYTSAGNLQVVKSLLARPDIRGVQVVYNWKMLEKEKGEYDFSPIDKDLAITNSLNKKLFLQVQDRFSSPEARNIPGYMLEGTEYGGGLAPQFDNPHKPTCGIIGDRLSQHHSTAAGLASELGFSMAERLHAHVGTQLT